MNSLWRCGSVCCLYSDGERYDVVLRHRTSRWSCGEEEEIDSENDAFSEMTPLNFVEMQNAR